MAFRPWTLTCSALAAVTLAGGAWAQGCGSATPIFVGDTPFNTAGATENLDLTGICDPGPFGDDVIYHTIWFSWVADTTDNYQISTCSQATFDTRLAVLDGGCDPSATIACLDDTTGCTGFTTILSFAAVQGQTYYFAVGGYSAATTAGSGTLTLSLASGGGGGGTCGPDNPQDCCFAGVAPGCSDQTCCETVCAADAFCCSTQWDSICAEEALGLCGRLCLVPCPLPSATVAEAEACGTDGNGGCNHPTLDVEYVSVGDSIAGTTWASGGTRDTDWFEFTLIDATEVTGSVYCSAPTATFLIDTSCPPSVLATGSGGCPNSWTRCLPPGTYRAFVALTVFDGFPCFGSSANDYVLTLSGIPCDASAPKNDECETAQRVSDGNTFFDTSFASTSPIPLDPSCDEGFGTAFVQDVWFKYTASCDGICTASTCSQASFDTRLAAYSDCFGSLVGCNDDGADCAGLTSEMIFPVSAGNDYYIRVGGFSGGGTGTLSISCSKAAGNDECEGATPVGDGDTSFDTTGATTSPLALDPQCDEGFGVAFVKDLWFAYQASCTGTVTVSTCNAASYDTRLAVYSDCIGTLVACNDDAAGCALTSSLQFSSTAGSTYYIRVGGYAAGGTGTLSVSCTKGGGGCTSNDTCACATAIALGDTAFNTTGASSDAPTSSPAFCGSFGTGFFRDVWFAYTPTEAGHLTVSTCNQATYDTRLELWSGCPSDGSSVVLVCNDDGEGCATFTSFMEADVSCGATYYVRVGSYSSGTTGSGTLTLALTNTTPCAPPCPADINGDGQVNGADLGLLIGNWGGSGTGDLNNDGLVNGADLGILIGNWGPCPT